MAKAQPQDNMEEDKENFVDELKPGTKLMHGQYTIESFLNAGGFGITYLARDSLDRKVVIKECFPGAFCRRSRYVVQARSRAHQNELKSIVRLFVQEARSLAKLDHPNIVGVHQVFEDNDTAYMALDFVSGRDLLDIIEDPNTTLTPVQIRNILKEVLGAVGFIHEQQILHRDISPDNILINKEFHPILIDFGAAREEATKQSRVLSALRVVKDGYSPQEFYIAGSDQSPSSDLYALAASFHHLITGEVPPNSQARLAAIASGEKDPYEATVGRFADYDDNFLGAIDKALAVLPKDRLQSAKDWLNMMDGNAGNVTPLNVAAAPTATASAAPAAAAAKKSNMPILLGSAAVVALLVGVGVFTMTGGDAPVAEAPATATETATTEPVAAAEVAAEAPAPAVTPEVAPAAEEATAASEAPAEDTVAVTDGIAAGEPATTAEAAVADEAVATQEAVVPADQDAVADAIAQALAASAAEAEATAAIVAQPAPVADIETPAITVDPALQQTVNDTTAVVAGPSGTDTLTPDVRPQARPDSVALAAVPAPVPLPEPVATPVPSAEAPVADDLPQPATTTPALDTQIGQVSAPDAPEIVSAVGSGPEVDILAVTPGNEIVTETAQVEVAAAPSVVDATVSTSWTVRMPFTPAGENSNIVAQAAAIAPVWVQPGIVITSVNGTPVESINQIPGVLRAQTPETSLAPTIPALFGISDPSSGGIATNPWVLPVVQEIVLGDGTRFETAYAGDGWKTTVAELASVQAGGLQVGDVISSYIPTSTAIDDRRTLFEILDRELANGVEQFTFAVQRNGSLWIASFTYSDVE